MLSLAEITRKPPFALIPSAGRVSSICSPASLQTHYAPGPALGTWNIEEGSEVVVCAEGRYENSQVGNNGVSRRAHTHYGQTLSTGEGGDMPAWDADMGHLMGRGGEAAPPRERKGRRGGGGE